ncbi:MAG: sulfotransferase [Terracidiphilus sp.]
MEETRLPSFIVVGPPRTGTSWLHKVLTPYANLPAPTKETRFFDLHFNKGFDWYLSHFTADDGHGPMGEVAPTYFVSADARQRIAKSIPNVKLIFMFRNPVQRVVSLYRMKRAYGMIPWDFEEALEKDAELISSGMYSTQFAEWRRMFPDHQMLVTIYDDLRSEPQQFIDTITSFLNIPHITLDDSTLARVYSSEKMTQPRSYFATRTATAFAEWCKARRLDQLVASVRKSALIKLFLGGGDPLTEASPVALQRLGERFRPEVEGLELFLGRHLEAWKINE